MSILRPDPLYDGYEFPKLSKKKRVEAVNATPAERMMMEEVMRAGAEAKAVEFGGVFDRHAPALPDSDMSFRRHMNKAMKAGRKAGREREEG